MPLKFSLLALVFLFIARTAIPSGRFDESYQLSNASHGFRVEPSTFSLYWSVPGKGEFRIAGPSWEKEIKSVEAGHEHISWTYPSSGISVSLKLYEEYLSISIHGGSVAEITWPRITADIDAYTIPLNQGKYIPAGDSLWARHLENQGRINALEALSMQFFALNVDEMALVFVIENIFNNQLGFSRRNGKISLDFTHGFPETSREKEYGFRIYPVSNDITHIAKTYRNYVLETRGILTLEEKAQSNPGIRKLYGAPHFYVWKNESSFPPGLLPDMYEAGIEKAWLGLNCRTAAETHPEFVSEANRAGYLIGPYDSYHSIHPPGEERWVTATFDDTTLYHTAYIMNSEGEPVRGFLGVGRKLNPLMAFSSVHSRTRKVFEQGIEFNSWFMDCDATGECYDDFTPSRMNSQRDDMEARLQRMAWIANEYDLVIGSETGNDFSSNTIAFAHGMTTPVIAWGDPDMRSNRDSRYYVGAYYSFQGGVPPRYVKPVPLKDEYSYIYYDNRFNIPLFQLVYNDAVITSHHWEWGSLKVPEEIAGVSLREILYNVPPLYHIDRRHWEQYREIISRHASIFAKSHARAVTLEMTGFDWLSADRLVQRTRFGESVEIIANFGSGTFRYNDMVIEGQGLAVHDRGTGEYYLYYPPTGF
jgi:hypothetical protein